MAKVFCAIFALLCAVQLAAASGYAPIVKLAAGSVRGIVQEVDISDDIPIRSVYLYQGIRYGRAERFSKPKPVEPWTDVYNATNFNFACPQQNIKHSDTVKYEMGMQTIVANEDCLFVNVFRPVNEASTPRAVMVWVHGGAFTEGTIFSSYYNARYIASMGDVIVVTVNYRLDAFGFLYGGTEDAPGNLGLYDQILALKWVQENIAKFGGDANQVTLFGESAGSFSVSALILSPLTKGLFHRAIMQSGATNSWLGSQSAARALEITELFAKKMKCPSPADKAEALKCLRSKSVDEILAASSVGLQNGESFIPIYNDGSVMPIPPVQALKEGKFNKDIDLMYGTTKNEGSMFVVRIFMLPQLDPATDGSDMTLDAAKTFITFMMTLFKDQKPEEVADYYVKHLGLKNDTAKDDLRMSISYVFGDYHLVCPTLFFGEEFAKHAESSKKLYSYRLMKGVATPVMFCRGWMGVCHAEDVVLMFGMPLMLRGIAFNEEESQFARELIGSWTNFAKSGEPGKLGSVQWEQAITKEDPVTRFIELDHNGYKMVSDFYKDTCDAFWKPRIFV